MNQHPFILRALVDERRDRFEARARRPRPESRRRRFSPDRHAVPRRRFVVVPRRA